MSIPTIIKVKGKSNTTFSYIMLVAVLLGLGVGIAIESELSIVSLKNFALILATLGLGLGIIGAEEEFFTKITIIIVLVCLGYVLSQAIEIALQTFTNMNQSGSNIMLCIFGAVFIFAMFSISTFSFFVILGFVSFWTLSFSAFFGNMVKAWLSTFRKIIRVNWQRQKKSGLLDRIFPKRYREEYIGDFLEYRHALKAQGFSKNQNRIHLLVQLSSIILAFIWQKVVDLVSGNKKIGK